MSATRLRDFVGIDPTGDVYITQIVGDPTTGMGCAAGVGTIAFRVDGLDSAGPAGTHYVKNGAAATAWKDISPAQALLNATGQSSGTAVTCDFDTGQVQQVLLNGVTPVITLQNFIAGDAYVLELTQDGVGSRIPTFSPALLGTVPTLTTTPGKRDVLFLYADALGNLMVYASVLNN